MAQVLDIITRAERLDAEDQVTLALRLAQLMAPFGGLGPAVVEPEVFKALLHQTLSGAQAADTSNLRNAHAHVSLLIEALDEEPNGPAFHAYAALCSLYYALEALLVDPRAGAVNAVKRVIEIGFADQDLSRDDLYPAVLSWLDATMSTGIDVPKELSGRVAEAAIALSSNWPS